MIPRTKVNYSLKQIFKAAFIEDAGQEWRNRLTRRISDLFGTENIILTQSGRGALYILFSCLPQKRLVVPAYTCKAVLEAAALAGKEIDFAETEDDGFNMDPAALEEKLNADTIVLATHQFGIPCDLDKISAAAAKAGAVMLEDAAGSLGSRHQGRLTGSFGQGAAFSFDSTKLINVPMKGGFIITKDKELHERCREFAKTTLKPMPQGRKWRYLLLGFIFKMLANGGLYRLFHCLKFKWRGRFTDESLSSEPMLGPFYTDEPTEWQAFIAAAQFDELEAIIARRRQLYSRYIKELSGAVSFKTPPEDVNAQWAPIRFPLRILGDKMRFYRLGNAYGLDFAFSFTFIGSPAEYKKSHALADSILDPPFYYNLTSDEFQKTVNILKRIDSEFQEAHNAVKI